MAQSESFLCSVQHLGSVMGRWKQRFILFYANENESNLHADDERMSDFQQNVLFTFNMLCLLLLYNVNY